MSVALDLPNERQRIQAKCVHPSGLFTEFETAALERPISERFEQIVTRCPDRVAIKAATRALTYAELNRRANRVALAVFVNATWCAADPTLGWTKLAVGGLDVHVIPGNHDTYATEHIHVLGRELRQRLERAVAEVRARSLVQAD